MQYLDITDVELFFYYLMVDVIVLCCYFDSAWKFATTPHSPHCEIRQKIRT
jgi:hypothetical protein